MSRTGDCRFAGTLGDLNGLQPATGIYVNTKPDGYTLAGDHKMMTQAGVDTLFAGANEGDET